MADPTSAISSKVQSKQFPSQEEKKIDPRMERIAASAALASTMPSAAPLIRNAFQLQPLPSFLAANRQPHF